jgi:pimeloyl-ACP methyl ester carboxylesterase
MSSVICLSGWGQNYRSLEKIFESSNFSPFSISSLDYSQFFSPQDFFSSIKSQNLQSDILVGWSLGGQLAIRLIAEKILQPKLLVLLAPPFQMVKDEKIKSGMPPQVFAEFYQNFSTAPDATLKKFSILTAMNDRNAKEIAKNLDVNQSNFKQLQSWLEELKNFSCFNVDFSSMPRVIFFQGAGDSIVHSSQAEYFQERIKNFRFELMKNCGHAPHLSDVEKVRAVILEEIGKF